MLDTHGIAPSILINHQYFNSSNTAIPYYYTLLPWVFLSRISFDARDFFIHPIKTISSHQQKNQIKPIMVHEHQ